MGSFSQWSWAFHSAKKSGGCFSSFMFWVFLQTLCQDSKLAKYLCLSCVYTSVLQRHRAQERKLSLPAVSLSTGKFASVTDNCILFSATVRLKHTAKTQMYSQGFKTYMCIILSQVKSLKMAESFGQRQNQESQQENPTGQRDIWPWADVLRCSLFHKSHDPVRKLYFPLLL